MSWQGWLTLGVVVAAIAALARDLLAPSATILCATILLLITRVITPEQAFSGFSNAAPITTAALYILARAVEKTGALQPVLSTVLGKDNGRHWSLARLLVPSACVSVFLNNTPIVAMLAPQVAAWADRRGQPRSRYLMPLSFVVLLGGMVSLMGTSTNLVVSGLLQASGQKAIGMFEISRAGLPVAILGIAAVILFAPKLLPDRRAGTAQLQEDIREFVVNMVVVRGGPLDGKTVTTGGLRHLESVFLVEIERDTELIVPVTPATVLRGGDRLSFVGRADQVVDLHSTRGLVSSEHQHLTQFDAARHKFFEAVVGPASLLVGHTMKEVDFRSRYQAAVVAIHRAGQRVKAKLGGVSLKVGDALVLLSDEGFRNRWNHHDDFLLVSRLGGSLPVGTGKAGLVGLLFLTVVMIAGMGLMPMLHVSLLAAVALVVLGVLTAEEARNAVNLDVILVIAAAFGLSAAIRVSGLADRIATLIIGAFGSFGAIGALLGLVVGTVLLLTIITNNAAAILIFPIAMATASAMHLNPRSFAMAITIAASASFLTPIGYQTNMMVYGLGGYRFFDYSRLGTPLTVLVVVSIVLLVPFFWPM